SSPPMEMKSDTCSTHADDVEFCLHPWRCPSRRRAAARQLSHTDVNVNPKGDHRANQNGTHPEHHARHWSPAPSGAGRDNSDISQPTAHATAASRGIGTTPR